MVSLGGQSSARPAPGAANALPWPELLGKEEPTSLVGGSPTGGSPPARVLRFRLHRKTRAAASAGAAPSGHAPGACPAPADVTVERISGFAEQREAARLPSPKSLDLLDLLGCIVRMFSTGSLVAESAVLLSNPQVPGWNTQACAALIWSGRTRSRTRTHSRTHPLSDHLSVLPFKPKPTWEHDC